MLLSLKIVGPRLIALLPAGLVFSFVCSTAYAAIVGTPVPFDDFAVTDGDITAGCPSLMASDGVTVLANPVCEDTTLGNGMLQRQITIPLNSQTLTYAGTYIQFILTDEGVTGDAAADPFTAGRGNLDFSNVEFIKMNNRGGGITTKTMIVDSTYDPVTRVEDRFVSESTYRYGSAFQSGASDPWVEVMQDISQVEYSADLLTATELDDMSAYIVSVGGGPIESNSLVELEQRILMGDVPGDGAQKFKHTRLVGGYTEQGTDILGIVNVNPILPGGTNGGSVTWNPADWVTATWVGFYDAAASNALFGYTRYANVSTGTDTSLVSLTDPEAVNWNNILGNASSRPILFGQVESIYDITTPTPSAVVLDPSIAIPTVRSDLFIPNIGTSTPPVTTPSFVPVYNQWRVDNGVFTADGVNAVACPVVASFCGVPIVNADGIYQRLVVIGGEPYYQTIMVDGSVTGDPTAADFAVDSIAFVNETYIKLGNGNSGISSKLHMASQDLAYQFSPVVTGGGSKIPLPTDSGEFIYDTTMNTGWANSGGLDPTLSVYQSLYVPEGLAIDTGAMMATFSMDVGATQADKQMVLTSNVSTRDSTTTFEQPVKFFSTKLTGAYQDSSRTAILDPFDPQYDPLLPSTGEDLGWAAGDALQATWVGGEYATTTGISTAGATSFSNLTTGESINNVSLESPDPDNWLIDPFGPEPVYP